MTSFSEYQAFALSTAKENIHPDVSGAWVYHALGLAGEAGEVANKVKKILRDYPDYQGGDHIVDAQIAQELGDVLWYVATLSACFDLSLEVVAALNRSKLEDRVMRHVIGGSGDNR